jgi:hypothetical protein
MSDVQHVTRDMEGFTNYSRCPRWRPLSRYSLTEGMDCDLPRSRLTAVDIVIVDRVGLKSQGAVAFNDIGGEG